MEVIDTSNEKLYTLLGSRLAPYHAQQHVDLGLVNPQQKGKCKMGSLKGKEPPAKKKPKKKPAKKNAAKK